MRMAGFNEDKTYDALNINKDEYEAMAAIAIGYYGDISTLSPDLAEREKPNQRKSVSQIAIEGKF